MPTGPDPYAVLGVDRSANAEEVRTAYRTRSMLLHPDLHEGRPEPVRMEARRAMAQLTEAYETVCRGEPTRSTAGAGSRTLAFRLGRVVGRALR